MASSGPECNSGILTQFWLLHRLQGGQTPRDCMLFFIHSSATLKPCSPKSCIKEICCCCLPVTPDQICLAVILLTVRAHTGQSACSWPHTWWATLNVLQDPSSEAVVSLTGKQCIIYIRKKAGVWNQSPRVPTLSKHWMKGVEELTEWAVLACLCGISLSSGGECGELKGWSFPWGWDGGVTVVVTAQRETESCSSRMALLALLRVTGSICLWLLTKWTFMSQGAHRVCRALQCHFDIATSNLRAFLINSLFKISSCKNRTSQGRIFQETDYLLLIPHEFWIAGKIRWSQMKCTLLIQFALVFSTNTHCSVPFYSV